MSRIKRKDKKYETVEEVILNFKYKELVAYFYTLGICYVKGVDVFTREN